VGVGVGVGVGLESCVDRLLIEQLGHKHVYQAAVLGEGRLGPSIGLVANGDDLLVDVPAGLVGARDRLVPPLAWEGEGQVRVRVAVRVAVRVGVGVRVRVGVRLRVRVSVRVRVIGLG
jgi:hypothetical protein